MANSASKLVELDKRVGYLEQVVDDLDNYTNLILHSIK